LRLFFFLICLLSFIGLEAVNKTVLLCILARNKAHVLPHFLDCIDALDYDKKQITVYINTNNNQDNTVEILDRWLAKKGADYRKVIYDVHEVKNLDFLSPHHWTVERLKTLSLIRNYSMQMAITTESDYYFVVDCDNFIAPFTLKALMAHDKPIIAPMLRAVPHRWDEYSNFFSAVDADGYWASADQYYSIVRWNSVGVFEVPVVHCTYLIQTRYIPELTYVDGSDHYDFVIFSRSAREKKIGQFICNEQPFGYILHPPEDITLEQEAALVRHIPELYVIP
jgi:Anp1